MIHYLSLPLIGSIFVHAFVIIIIILQSKEIFGNEKVINTVLFYFLC